MRAMTRTRSSAGTVAPALTAIAPSWWPLVRWMVWAGAAISIGLAILLATGASDSWLSADGRMEASSRRLLTILQAVLAGAGVVLAALGRTLRQHTARKERLIIGVVFAATACIVSIGLCEVGLRATSSIRPLRAERHFFFLHDQVLGWKHRPGAVARFKDAVVRINSRGLRDDEIAPAPVGTRQRLLFLGDSQVFGDGVEADETFVQGLEHGLRDVEAINAGVIGYGTDQQLLYYEREGAALKPNLIAVGLNAYDLRDNISTRVRSGYLKPRFELTGGKLSLLNVPVSQGSIVDRVQRRLRSHSHLYTFLTAGSRASANRGEGPAASLAADIYPSAAQLDTALSVTRELLRRLASDVREHGSRLVVIFLPYQMDFSGEADYKVQSDRMVRILGETGLQEGFLTWDLRPHLNPAANLYLDTMHFNTEGHRQVAAALRNLSVDQGVISSDHVR